MNLQTPRINNETLLYLLKEIYDNILEITQLVIWRLWYKIMWAADLGKMAVKICKLKNVQKTRLNRGVAYNETIANIIKDVVKDNDLKFYVYDLVPSGDVGISF